MQRTGSGVSWLGLALLMGVGWASVSASRHATPVWNPGSAAAQVASLEARLGQDRADLDAALGLSRLFLERNAPGYAEAVLSWAAPQQQDHPALASLRVQSLTELGRMDDALALQRSILVRCELERGQAGADDTDGSPLPGVSCSRALVARGKQRERLLVELLAQGVTHPASQPERVLLAQNRAARTGRLAD